MQLAVTSATFSTDVRVAIRQSRAAGFVAMVFDLKSPALDLSELSGSGAREFRNLLATHEQQLAAIQVSLGAKGLGREADVDQALSQIDLAMRSARDLGAAGVCLDVGPLPEPARAATSANLGSVSPLEGGLIIIPEKRAPVKIDAGEPGDPTAQSHVDSVLKELGNLADRQQMMLAMRSELSSIAALHRAMSAAGCPWFYVDLDPVHCLRDRWSVDDIFATIAPKIGQVRLRDALKGSGQRTSPAMPGSGSTDWAQWNALLHEAAFNGFGVVDAMDLPDRARSAVAIARFVRALV